MFKLLTLALILITFTLPGVASAEENVLFPGQLSTKGLVRMSLWYEGISSIKSSENQEVKRTEISEELERALDKLQ